MKEVKGGLISREFNDRLDTYIVVMCKVIGKVSYTKFGTFKTSSLQTSLYHESLNGQKIDLEPHFTGFCRRQQIIQNSENK